MILPGGFAHGDYLRTGAIARFSPVMTAVRAFADAGNPVIGICNGFQVLLEAGLLPGAMLRNDRKYRCEYVHARVEQTDTPFTSLCAPGQVLKIPDRARRGQLLRGSADARTARAQPAGDLPLRHRRQGEVTTEANPNGSLANIAGICNEARNVVGLMPHPERACESALGSDDGKIVLESVVSALIART